jgi:serine/threonine protein kinase
MSNFIRRRRLNAGGQGEVWVGQAPDGSEVAMKYLLLNGNDAQREEDLRRFQREITCQSSLSHDGVLPILAMDVLSAEPHFVMPLADGSLRDLLGTNPVGLEESNAVDMFASVLEAVDYAHKEGVIHRDLKPENILLINGTPVLSDFGLGRRMFSDSTTLTVTHAAMGTFAYSAPEQFTDAHNVDVRADVFALGRIFYEMLTGELAFHGIDLDAVPAQFRFLINKATQRDADRRFESVAEMLREMKVLGDGPQDLLAPAERATALMSEVAAGELDRVSELGRIFLENGDDPLLYTQTLPAMPQSVIAQLATKEPDQFFEVIRRFDQYADGSFPWDHTDTLAIFLFAVYQSTSDFRVHGLVLERLLVLGYSHNRWFVRNRFVAAVGDALKRPENAPLVAEVLRNHPETHAFVRGSLLDLSLPTIVAEAVAA